MVWSDCNTAPYCTNTALNTALLTVSQVNCPLGANLLHLQIHKAQFDCEIVLSCSLQDPCEIKELVHCCITWMEPVMAWNQAETKSDRHSNTLE